jgi:hypothetical protein
MNNKTPIYLYNTQVLLISSSKYIEFLLFIVRFYGTSSSEIPFIKLYKILIESRGQALFEGFVCLS